MEYRYRAQVVLIVLICNAFIATGQFSYDSVLTRRNKLWTDYETYRKSEEKNTWVKLSALDKKAAEILLIDHEIINYHLRLQQEKAVYLQDMVEKLNLERALLKKESEVQSLLFEEQRFMIKILMFTSAFFFLISLVLLFFMIDRNTRYRSLKIEIDRIWSMKEMKQPGELKPDETDHFRSTMRELNEVNARLEMKNQNLEKLLHEKSELLNREIDKNKTTEKEVKDILDLIKIRKIT
jgi:hypothetical protein